MKRTHDQSQDKDAGSSDNSKKAKVLQDVLEYLNDGKAS